MNKLIFVLLLFSTAFGAILVAFEEPPTGDWTKVKEAMDQGRPQTAIEELEPIIRSALEAENYDAATKAIAMKIMLEGTIQGNKPEERITRLQAILAEQPEPMRPVLEVVLANWYWDYFQQNRWRFMQRTQTGQEPGPDILTWDLARILAEIDRHFSAALEHKEQLQSTKVEQFDELLAKGTMPDACRPTMFDFVAYDALEFYSAGEQAGAAAQDAFILSADTPIFDSWEKFRDWQIETTDQDSPTLKGLRLYQSLLSFHQRDDDPTALAEADLSRLEFGHNHAVGETKNARYKNALQEFAQQRADLPVSARALANQAQVLRSEQSMVEAHTIAQQGWKAFPDSVGGRLCYNLIQEIEAREIEVSIERVWNNPWSAIHVDYRNLTQVHFRAIRYDWEQLVKRVNYYPMRIDDELRSELLSKKPDKQWSHDLPATEDFLTSREDFTVPDELQPGFYFLLASADEQFSERDNRVLVQEFWVSPLSLLVRTGSGPGKIGGFVLEADTGEPLQDAQIRIWAYQRSGRQYKWIEKQGVTSDANGLFQINGSESETYLLLARHKDRALSTASQLRGYMGWHDQDPFERTVFFTDRALYRPGQTVHFKGILASVDQKRDKYQTLKRQTVTVVFVDPNQQEIARQDLQTNDYGSFSGSFTAPRDRLMGTMQLRDAARDGSFTQFNVEEYKRPKFKVELEKPEQDASLGGDVLVPGTAKAYTGATIGGANVRYRVLREVRYPSWWYWLCWWNPPQAEAQEIASGSTTTLADGTFAITFTARPDPRVSAKDEPIFHFTVHADVTDTTGETRSDERSVNVGYTALQASMAADDWQTAQQEVKLRVSTQSLDAAPRAAKGTIKVYQLQQPDQVHRQKLTFHRPWQPKAGDDAASKIDWSNINSWPLGAVAVELPFATDASGTTTVTCSLSAGPYRALLETQDAFGKPVTALLPLTVVNPEADSFAIKIPNYVGAPQWSLEPGKTFTGVWGTGYESGRAFIEVEHRGKTLQGYWTRPTVTQATLEQNITEAMRGGFTVRITQVRENRLYFESRHVSVPWTNKQLTLKWEHFVSKLSPGQEESWSAIITGANSEAAVAEMVAALYDASLDAYLPHNWPNLQMFRHDGSPLNVQFENVLLQLRGLLGYFETDRKDSQISYRSLPPELKSQHEFFGVMRRGRAGVARGMVPMAAAPGAMMDGAAPEAEGILLEKAAPMDAFAANAAPAMAGGLGGEAGAGGPPQVDLSNVAARTNLNETAFFFPHLVSDKNGQVTMKFTMPEALTEWKFLGFAHDAQMRNGSLTDSAVTSKDLMVEPLAPRFVREGDILQFTVKVTNQSPARQTGTVRLTFSDARTLDPVDAQLENSSADQSFDIPSQQSESFSWHIKVPDGMGFLIYKAVGSTGRLSDGEEGYLPVLSRRILVRESLPLPIRGAGTRNFTFDKLLQSAQSDTIQNELLTVQMVSQPAWYAVMALPYLMEYPYECTEQTFNRLYANALAQHIANADPKIRRIFDQWKGTETLDSPMEKNEDLKAVMLEETPWVRQAQKESEARRNVGILFDANRLQDELGRALRKLGDMQEEDGSWPWFSGGPPNDFITLYITTGFGRLRHLGADVDVTQAVKSLTRLDAWMNERYRDILEHGTKEDNHLTPTVALFLYGRSFFLNDQAVAGEHQEAVNYFLDQARTYWTKLGNRQSQAHVALALKRFGDNKTPQDIMISLKERSVSSEELGMYWRDTELSWWWYRAPIETQAMMIEAFDEVSGDAESVEACRVWLLKQKQTRDWKTTKATADAVYSLLLRGANLLSSDALVQVKLGDQLIEPTKVEAGTGFYEQRFVRGEIKPDMGNITVTKTDPGVSWGSVHWQYLEEMSKVTPYEGTPLTLKKQLYIKEYTPKGPVLTAVSGPISVGDELVVRLELRVDRDMEYVHLKDQRGSGVEPVNVLSRYRFQDGLAYYETTRDTASHFFIDYLPKGTYVFEYSTRVVNRGQYQSGMAEIQCMYAPEFNSHSESLLLSVE